MVLVIASYIGNKEEVKDKKKDTIELHTHTRKHAYTCTHACKHIHIPTKLKIFE